MASQLPRRTIVFVPFAAHGHVTPMLQLARALADRGDVSVTVAVPDFIHRRMVQYRSDAGAGVVLAPIPSGVKDDGGDEPPGAAAIMHAMEHHMPSQLEAMLTAMQGVISCLVVDLLASWAIPVAARCGLPVVGFWAAMTASYRAVAVIPELISKGFVSESGTLLKSTDGIDEDNSFINDHDLVGDLRILPAKLKLRGKDLPWLVSGAVSQESRFAFWLQTANRAKSLRSIIVNSFSGEDDGGYDPPQGLQKILHVGPALLNEDPKKTTTSMWQADRTSIDWLDKQRPRSVIYVSFGSWAAPIDRDKVAGFARGLEASGRPFLWALKNHPSWRAGLPDGCTEKLAGRGKIVSWAPQDDVLRNDAVGCFVTHAGWNSVMEALRRGVRMICYPICGDHFVNCAYVVNMWGAGIALPSSDERDVRDCIRRVMDEEGEEGRRLQEKVDGLKEMITGEAMRIARTNINLLMEEINGGADDSTIKGQE